MIPFESFNEILEKSFLFHNELFRVRRHHGRACCYLFGAYTIRESVLDILHCIDFECEDAVVAYDDYEVPEGSKDASMRKMDVCQEFISLVESFTDSEIIQSIPTGKDFTYKSEREKFFSGARYAHNKITSIKGLPEFIDE